jgi:hypothetical protein
MGMKATKPMPKKKTGLTVMMIMPMGKKPGANMFPPAPTKKSKKGGSKK